LIAVAAGVGCGVCNGSAIAAAEVPPLYEDI